MLAPLVGFAFVFGMVLARVGLPPMVGFLLAGFCFNLIGLAPPEGLQAVSDLGVTLLLFTIGLKLDLRGLARPEIWGTSVVHLVLTTALIVAGLRAAEHLAGGGLFDLSFGPTLILAFALAFSSTVFAVKVLDEQGDLAALHGKVAIGILIMQDIFAVVFLALSEGRYPALWALSVLLLVLPAVRRVLHRLLEAAGHGELLILGGFFFALVTGSGYFYAVGLKGDLGALILGIVLGSHPKSAELAKALGGIKELMLVGFFLSIGMMGTPTPMVALAGVGLCLLLPAKVVLYHLVASRFGLRARPSALTALTLGTYSEFGLIVAALGVAQGWLPVDWLLVVAIAVGASFIVAAPFGRRPERSYQALKPLWNRLAPPEPDPPGVVATGAASGAASGGAGRPARALVIGMGRVGTGAYDELRGVYGEGVLGVEHDEARVEEHRAAGRNVIAGDASDTAFWAELNARGAHEMILLAMPGRSGNLFAAEQIRNLGMGGRVVAVARFPEEVAELAALDVAAFNIHAEAGSGIARHALARLRPPAGG